MDGLTPYKTIAKLIVHSITTPKSDKWVSFVVEYTLMTKNPDPRMYKNKLTTS